MYIYCDTYTVHEMIWKSAGFHKSWKTWTSCKGRQNLNELTVICVVAVTEEANLLATWFRLSSSAPGTHHWKSGSKMGYCESSNMWISRFAKIETVLCSCLQNNMVWWKYLRNQLGASNPSELWWGLRLISWHMFHMLQCICCQIISGWERECSRFFRGQNSGAKLCACLCRSWCFRRQDDSFWLSCDRTPISWSALVYQWLSGVRWCHSQDSCQWIWQPCFDDYKCEPLWCGNRFLHRTQQVRRDLFPGNIICIYGNLVRSGLWNG